MAAQGSGGAYEISQRMTAAVGWGATASFKEDWVWDQAAATYALDPEMAATLRKNNPQARMQGFVSDSGSNREHRRARVEVEPSNGPHVLQALKASCL